LADNSAKRILFGADGIRPGWGVLLFVLLLVGFELLVFVLLSRDIPAAMALVSGAVLWLVASVAIWRLCGYF